MKRFPCLLPIVLALTGCVEDKPTPHLSSPDPRERVEAARQAAAQYGAHPAAQPSAPAAEMRTARKSSAPDTEFFLDLDGPVLENSGAAPLVGRWNLPWRPWAYNQFNADGTFHSAGLLTSSDGTYRLLPQGVLELTVRTAATKAVVELKYRLRGNRLEICLEEPDYWQAYTRAQ